MLILLPPSETKHARTRGHRLDVDSLSFPELSDVRHRVLDALTDVGGRDDAAEILGVSSNLTEDLARNTRLRTTPALPVQDLYTGVLYDALDLGTLDAAALRRARRWLVVVSALYGAVRPRDKVAPYRLSMAVNLPGLGPVAAAWREPLDDVLSAAAGRGVIVDCRSSTYVAAWTPRGDLARKWVQIRVPGATHMAKHTRGLLARHLCQVGKDVRTPQALEAVAADGFSTTLTAPARTGQPWVLDVSTP
ncbi:YaaA family protein [Luteipulveratus mongoliensis]|uniref:Uncharacterized protein n=1 Tax=Luteipulveratus mongoliensis TaxID=571913 RepID=A0A0K1JJ56_9MICO|nr:peroxide stress protein YaaA [Luteipulveratus mongoliensis]AKU16625.1 hypothetical protein VV02_13395 [Luteipulveratus mongoliensis]